MGNLLTKMDPLSHVVVTNRYNSHRNPGTTTDGLSHAMTYTINGYDVEIWSEPTAGLRRGRRE
jgi:hypothetical protein